MEKPGLRILGLCPTSFLHILLKNGLTWLPQAPSAGRILRWPWMLVLLPKHGEGKNCKANGPFIKLVFKGEKRAWKYVHIGILWPLDKTISKWHCEAGMPSIRCSTTPPPLKAGQWELTLRGNGLETLRDLRSSLMGQLNLLSGSQLSRTVHCIVIPFKGWTKEPFLSISKGKKKEMKQDLPYFWSVKGSWTWNPISCASDVQERVMCPFVLPGWSPTYVEKSMSSTQ